MGTNEIVATVILFVLWVLILVGVIVNDLTAWEDNDADNYLIYGSTELRLESDFGKSTTSYSESCDDGSDTACDLAGAGMGYLICAIIAIITGLVCLIYGGAYSNDKLGLLLLKCPLKECGPLKVPSVLSILTGLLCIIGAIIWATLDMDDYCNTDCTLGISWYLTLIAGVGFLVFTYAFEKVYSSNPIE